MATIDPSQIQLGNFDSSSNPFGDTGPLSVNITNENGDVVSEGFFYYGVTEEPPYVLLPVNNEIPNFNVNKGCRGSSKYKTSKPQPYRPDGKYRTGQPNGWRSQYRKLI